MPQTQTASRSRESDRVAAKCLIELADVHKIYHMGATDVRALDGVDLKIGAGEFVSITGPSGSGKSTMMGILGCLDRPTKGSYYLDGLLVGKLSESQLAETRNQRIGFVFQTFNLLARVSAAENVAVPLFYARRIRTHEAAMAALQKVGLAERARHVPAELSGGERQRVAIARAIVNNPKVILADEPTGNLDTRTGAQIMQIFHQLHQQGVTVVIVTHEHDVAVQAQRIVQMRDGKIVHDGPTDPRERQAAMEETAALVRQTAAKTE